MPDALSGLPVLLAALGHASHPDEVAAALINGPGRHVGALLGSVMWARPPYLVVVGTYGLPAHYVDDLESVALDSDLQMCRAYWEAEAIVDPIDEMLDRYSDIEATPQNWRDFADSLGSGSVASSPIVSAGAVVGVYSMACREKSRWSTVDIALLDAIGCALGLWLTHSASGLPSSRSDRSAPDLTARQQRCLELIAAGSTNTAMAAVLGVSASTIKQEIGRLLTVLAATDRQDAVRRAVEFGLLAQVRR